MWASCSCCTPMAPSSAALVLPRRLSCCSLTPSASAAALRSRLPQLLLPDCILFLASLPIVPASAATLRYSLNCSVAHHSRAIFIEFAVRRLEVSSKVQRLCVTIVSPPHAHRHTLNVTVLTDDVIPFRATPFIRNSSPLKVLISA